MRVFIFCILLFFVLPTISYSLDFETAKQIHQQKVNKQSRTEEENKVNITKDFFYLIDYKNNIVCYFLQKEIFINLSGTAKQENRFFPYILKMNTIKYNNTIPCGCIKLP